MSRVRQYHVRNRATGRWLYEWVTDITGQRFPVWTHAEDKAIWLDAFEAALAVTDARNKGFPEATRVRAQ